MLYFILHYKYITVKLKTAVYFVSIQRLFLILVFSVFFDNRIAFKIKILFVFIQKAFKLPFVMTQFFFTVCTGKAAVCCFRKALRIKLVCNFPSDKQNDCTSQYTQVKRVLCKHQRCKHHCIVPVVYTAGCAAFVFHKPCLKRAEKQNANHITGGICKAY